MSDYESTTQGQIWLHDDGINKFDVEERDFILRGKRYVLVLQNVYGKVLALPFTSSKTRYENIDVRIQTGKDSISYVAIDSPRLVSDTELARYIGQCNPDAFNRILLEYFDFIVGRIKMVNGKFERLSNIKREPQIYKLPNIDFNRCNIETVGSVDDVQPDPEVKAEVEDSPSFSNKGRLRRFVLTAKERIDICFNMSVSEACLKHKLEAPDIYYIRKSTKKILNIVNKDKYSIDDKIFIATNTTENIMKKYDLKELPAEYLHHIFLQESKSMPHRGELSFAHNEHSAAIMQ